MTSVQARSTLKLCFMNLYTFWSSCSSCCIFPLGPHTCCHTRVPKGPVVVSQATDWSELSVSVGSFLTGWSDGPWLSGLMVPDWVAWWSLTGQSWWSLTGWSEGPWLGSLKVPDWAVWRTLTGQSEGPSLGSLKVPDLAVWTSLTGRSGAAVQNAGHLCTLLLQVVIITWAYSVISYWHKPCATNIKFRGMGQGLITFRSVQTVPFHWMTKQ